ncbi:sensor histidine kinase [Streptomyces sp. NBC_01304]|uniref:sensor histidine kinase n=1 Tax=Streptomyces sp. NBC_01304 TaxID=2903818 RepID=UPI002E15AB7A|nr:histidine kinase [Streptomyces sp. NBC_01304]
MASVADRLRDGMALLRRPTGPLPCPTRRGLVFDALLALAVGLDVLYWAAENGADLIHDSAGGIGPFGQLSRSGSLVVAVLLTVFAYAPLVLRRRYPLGVLWLVTCAAALTPPEAQRLSFYAVVIAAYTAAAYSPYRPATLATLAVTVTAVGTDDHTRIMGVMARPPIVPTQYVPLLILIPLIFAAHGLRTWKLRTAEGQERMSALEREQSEKLRRATEQERARIARELHDVVTHNVSMMTIQAGAARKVMNIDPAEAHEALLAVEAAGRSALAELRHTMGLLTMNAEDATDPAGTADLAPQPGLDQLESLVAGVRHTGVPVTLTTTGTPRDLPSGIELTAYRVVQEALTNTVKHATGARADVTLAYRDDHVHVEITDSGGSPSAAAATGNGHGLLGLRERLTVYGGTLHTGRRLTGGYRVEARIPLETT